MSLACGIVGLPNVGKSTLFNALTAGAAAQVGNYPFSTVAPNVGRVAVPDSRLQAIAAIVEPRAVEPSRIEFVDIAGLVRGASRGEGLGNRFLARIREVDAVIHLLRCFGEGDVGHVDGGVDPLRDMETVETELMLADLESLERRRGRERAGEALRSPERAAIEAALDALRAGRPARGLELRGEDGRQLRLLHLLSAKPVLHVCNVGDGVEDRERADAVARRSAEAGAACVSIQARTEAELAQIADAAERAAFLEALGLDEPGLHKVIGAAYRLLGLITFFTTGPKEVRAWTLRDGARAPEAAGRVHGDFEKGFIRAETVAWEDFVAHGGEQGARQAGRMRLEGRDYRVRDGDVLSIRFSP